MTLDVRTRQVLALVGNYEGAAGGLDRATQSQRQPGSTFKPIVYSYAIHARRYTPATLVDVQPTVFAGNYKPGNYEGWTGTDPLRLREVLANSVNVGAVHVLEDVGPANVVDWAKALGIDVDAEARSLARARLVRDPSDRARRRLRDVRGGRHVRGAADRHAHRRPRRQGRGAQGAAAAAARARPGRGLRDDEPARRA